MGDGLQINRYFTTAGDDPLDSVLWAVRDSRITNPDGSIVFDVHDDFCEWNTGRWKLADGAAARTDEAADIALSAASLGSAYLGGISFSELARAGRAEELQDGALSRADGLFRWNRHPWCPEIF